MMSTQNDFRSSFYTALIGLAISVYGFFGSLGHLMAILLVVSFLVLDSRKIYSEKLNKEALWLYLGLTSALSFPLSDHSLTRPSTHPRSGSRDRSLSAGAGPDCSKRL